MFCPKCGKEIKDDVKFCPYCGADLSNIKTGDKEAVEGEVVDKNSTVKATPKTDSKNETTDGKMNICALLGFIFSFFSYLGLAGFILSIVGLSQIKKDPSQKGYGFAVAGVVIGVVSFVISLTTSIIKVVTKS